MLNLNIPKILPDELGTAYIEHIALGNTLTTGELLSKVRNAKPRPQNPSKAQLIAEIAGLSDSNFVCSHTCKPFYGAFERTTQWCNPHGTGERGFNKNPMLTHRRVGYYLCPECASEDVDFWGRSYWRRSHQITGVSWCSKHETPLNVVPEDFLPIQPHEAIHASQQCTTSPFPNKNTIPDRYQKLVCSLLEFRSPVLLSGIVRTLKQNLRSKNYSCWTLAFRQRFVSDTILETCPTQWCHELFSNFEEKIAGKYFRDIDSIDVQRNDQAIMYVLAFAVLYDNPDEAASEISYLFRRKKHLQWCTEPVSSG